MVLFLPALRVRMTGRIMQAGLKELQPVMEINCERK